MIRIGLSGLPPNRWICAPGTDTALARVIKVFGAAHPHHAYLFANRRANRMKVLVHDGFGIWLAARRLHEGHFIWPNAQTATKMQISEPQLQALVLGLPWHRIGESARHYVGVNPCKFCCCWQSVHPPIARCKLIWQTAVMVNAQALEQMNAQQLRDVVLGLMGTIN